MSALLSDVPFCANPDNAAVVADSCKATRVYIHSDIAGYR